MATTWSFVCYFDTRSGWKMTILGAIYDIKDALSQL